MLIIVKVTCIYLLWICKQIEYILLICVWNVQKINVRGCYMT